MCVEGEVVQATVGETVAIVARVLDFGDEADFCEGGDAFVYARAAAQAAELCDERGRDDFVVLTALLDLQHHILLAGISLGAGVKGRICWLQRTAASTRQSSALR